MMVPVAAGEGEVGMGHRIAARKRRLTAEGAEAAEEGERGDAKPTCRIAGKPVPPLDAFLGEWCAFVVCCRTRVRTTRRRPFRGFRGRMVARVG
jgi:hypothetical protein